MALRISFSIATNPYVVGKVSVEVPFLAHSTTRGCASLVRASIVLWYRSPDVEISSRASYKISQRSLESCSQSRMAVRTASIDSAMSTTLPPSGRRTCKGVQDTARLWNEREVIFSPECRAVRPIVKLANSWQIGFFRDIPRKGKSENRRVFTGDLNGGPGWT